MSYNLEHKVCVITGAASGIGYGIADCFLQNRAKTVIILDIEQDKGIQAVETLLNKHGKRVFYYKCDVTKDLEEVWSKLISTYKTIDILINNAGILREEDPRKTFEVNTLAVINWSLKFWEHARKDKGGSGGIIINVASINGYRANPYVPIYNASKSAVISFTKSFGHSYNYNKFGIKTISICPGLTLTNVLATLKPWSSDQDDYNIWVKSLVPQAIGDVAEAVLEVIKSKESGTAWEIEGARPITEI